MSLLIVCENLYQHEMIDQQKTVQSDSMKSEDIHAQLEYCDSVAHTLYEAFFHCWTYRLCFGKKKPLYIEALEPVPTITLGQCEWITFETASRLIHEFGLGLYELVGEQQIII